jgi:hypothetical protein
MNKPKLIQDLGMLFPNENSKHKWHYGNYECPYCLKIFKAIFQNMRRGHHLSCGCQKANFVSLNRSTHGLSDKKIYYVWEAMIDRCTKPKNKRYKNYGGRGITVCEEWKNDPTAFYVWAMLNGYEEGLVLDRINNDGNYEPSNLFWG